MISQIVGNIVTRSACTNDNDLLSGVFFRGLIFKGVDDFALEFFLQQTGNQCHVRKEEQFGGSKDLFGELGNSPCSSPESRGHYEVGWAEDAFEFRSVREYSCQVDDPCSRGILFGGRDGRGVPDVELHYLCVEFEPICQLFKGIEEGRWRGKVDSSTF